MFEDRKVKAETDQEGAGRDRRQDGLRLQHLDAADHLAGGEFKDPARFIGIHFFSPVERMMLVEIILGKKTGDVALATALDFVRAIRKTPIVVNDSRGFFANRCVLNYIQEGHLMFMEGVPAAMIENVGRMAGMPLGPLSLNDEVALDLGWKILKATEADLGPKAVDAEQKWLLQELVEKRGRLGRKNGKGFYDYPPKRPEAAVAGPRRTAEEEARSRHDRHPGAQVSPAGGAVAGSRALRGGGRHHRRARGRRRLDPRLRLRAVLRRHAVLHRHDGRRSALSNLCKRLEKKYGPRFKPPKLLLDMAQKGDTFYGRFAPGAAQAA